jgi:hypothetical protein
MAAGEFKTDRFKENGGSFTKNNEGYLDDNSEKTPDEGTGHQPKTRLVIFPGPQPESKTFTKCCQDSKFNEAREVRKGSIGAFIKLKKRREDEKWQKNCNTYKQDKKIGFFHACKYKLFTQMGLYQEY